MLHEEQTVTMVTWIMMKQEKRAYTPRLSKQVEDFLLIGSSFRPDFVTSWRLEKVLTDPSISALQMCNCAMINEKCSQGRKFTFSDNKVLTRRFLSLAAIMATLVRWLTCTIKYALRIQ
jgi:hypothetical protein